MPHYQALRAASLALGLAAGVTSVLSTAAEVVTIEARQWASETNGPYVTWPDAEQYCAELELGGHGDWRLPTLDELETLSDPQSETGIEPAVALDGCCLWSGTSLIDLPAEDGDEIAGTPDRYRWGFMFDAGVRYYAVHIFEDGQALCTRDP